MFVLPACQGKGIGSKLTQEVITLARRLGYRAIRLDTVPRLDRAIRIYEGAGSTRIPPIVTIRPQTRCSWSSG